MEIGSDFPDPRSRGTADCGCLCITLLQLKLLRWDVSAPLFINCLHFVIFSFLHFRNRWSEQMYVVFFLLGDLHRSFCPHDLWRWNRQSVPNRRHIKFRRQGNRPKQRIRTTFTARRKFEIRYKCILLCRVFCTAASRLPDVFRLLDSHFHCCAVCRRVHSLCPESCTSELNLHVIYGSLLSTPASTKQCTTYQAAVVLINFT